MTFITAGSSPVVATCGGWNDQTILSSCHVLRSSQSLWTTGEMGDLPAPRFYAAVATLEGVGTYLLGGSELVMALRTSVFLAAESMAWEEGPILPKDMDWPCAAKITSTSFLLLYGNTIVEYDTSLGGWRPAGTWPDLLTFRRGLGCTVMGRTLVIAGGLGGLKTTETLQLDTKTIAYGPSMATPRWAFHLATILPGPRVLAVGGEDYGEYYGDFYWTSGNVMDSVEELVDGTWMEAAPMETRRSIYGAVVIPKGLVCT